ncbi:hypothetical protein [Salegentibacter maritimus]|uniref:hypothetical protein n=1 Tax=Salegentibacter maritimus TaxID=2794347 RepID=UPI0018E4A080|nr:hypothetical protein [Salegentibacter maritimus]MBI6115966.1 hypothetical protein [Salegentibacter maritimus]
MNPKITYLKATYDSHWNANPKDLYNHYIKKKEKALLDSIAAATAINAIFFSDYIDYNKITPEMADAFQTSFPNLELNDLIAMSGDQLDGIISNWKGKLFEFNVRDKLNSGELVGDIQLEEGQYAVVSDSLTQPGWDLQILNADGSIAQELQAKATDSLSYINEAFEKYPDIDIISTSEVADLNGSLLNSDISNEDITSSLIDPVKSLFDSPIENFLETIFPALPVLIITGTEGRKYLMGRQSAAEGLQSGIKRGTRSAAAMSVGALLAWMDFGIFSIGGTFALNYFWGRNDDEKEAIKILAKQEKDLRLIAAKY